MPTPTQGPPPKPAPHPDSIAVGNPGPLPGAPPLTPEQKERVQSIVAQMSDPLSPYGHIGIALGMISKEKPQD